MKNLLLLLFVISFELLCAQTNLRCYTLGMPMGVSDYNLIGYYLNNNPVETNGCQIQPAVIIAVIDSTCNPWNNCNHNFGQSNIFTPITGCSDPGTGTCSNRAQNYFIFRFNSPQMDSLSIMLA